MEERFLHYIWQYQYFEKPICSASGERVSIIIPGQANNDSGPDFLNAQVEIDDLKWVGHIEIHTKASEWYAHGHESDQAYDNVVLHVVWDNDQGVTRKDGSRITTISLKNKVNPSTYDRYRKLISNQRKIPCEAHLSEIKTITRVSLLDKVVMERLITKSGAVWELLKQNHGSWDEVAYQLVARNFGFKTNSESFQTLAKSIPFKVALKEANDITKMEALLFGQAGFLEGERKDSYHRKLGEEFSFLAHKYQLTQLLSTHQWKFMRLRPANFPTIRIAQFARLLHTLSHLFSWIIETKEIKELKSGLKVIQSDYWTSHYQFGVRTKSNIPGMGEESVSNLIINTIVPLLVAYGKSIDDQQFIDRALTFLQNTPRERNRITNIWDKLGWPITSAFDSQATIELNNSYCRKKRCLSCSIGHQIIQST